MSVDKLRRFAITIASGAVFAGALVHSTQALAWTFGWGGETVAGSGTIVSSTRAVSGFAAIDVSIPANVKIVQGEAEGLVIRSDDNIVALVETPVERGTLQIKFAKKHQSVQVKTLDITVFVKDIDTLTISGSGAFLTDKLKAGNLKCRINGSGDMVLKGLEAGKLDVAIAGSGSVQGGGRAETLEASIAGSGDVKLGSVAVKQAQISIAGSGDAQLWVSQKLSVKIAGSGDVRFWGDPVVSSSVAGSGNVQRLGAEPPAGKP